MQNKPTILISNDDGIDSKGIYSLVEAARPFGRVVVVAPDMGRSGASHSITLEAPLTLKKVDFFEESVESYICSGTPVDCIKAAKHLILKGQPIDLCLSGINHGSNASTNILYSGTMGAAMEAAMAGIPSIGLSLLDHDSNADFRGSIEVAKKLIPAMLEGKFNDTKLLNVNIPALNPDDLQGIKFCRQARGYWEETFIKRNSPAGKPYYWLDGSYTLLDKGEDTDIWALNNNYASVVPVMFDLTAHKELNLLNETRL